jgi:predicted pyridoxine 5'-phosphate oxidase superfamily flavin-nucleotide-binding protein
MAIPSDIAFTPAVKAAQTRKGSRPAYARWEIARGMQDRVTPDLAEFIAERRSFYLATSNADGQPYIQHRGGPPGFLRVLNHQTLGIADFRGNRQHVSLGNLSENPKACIFLMDYEHRRRIKIWGRARIVEEDSALVETLFPGGYGAKAEQAMLFSVDAWDANCPQHIRTNAMTSGREAAYDAS